MELSLYFVLHFSFVKTPKCRSKERTASPQSCPRTKSKPPVHHFCQSRLFDHFAWIILQSLSTDCRVHDAGFREVPALSLSTFLHTQCFIKYVHNPQTNAIFMYRLRWVFVPSWSPYKTNLTGKKSDFMSYCLPSMPTAIFMNRLLMVILRIYWLYLVLFVQYVHSVSHMKKRSLVSPSTFLCELILKHCLYSNCLLRTKLT